MGSMPLGFSFRRFAEKLPQRCGTAGPVKVGNGHARLQDFLAGLFSPRAEPLEALGNVDCPRTSIFEGMTDPVRHLWMLGDVGRCGRVDHGP